MFKTRTVYFLEMHHNKIFDILDGFHNEGYMVAEHNNTGVFKYFQMCWEIVEFRLYAEKINTPIIGWEVKISVEIPREDSVLSMLTDELFKRKDREFLRLLSKYAKDIQERMDEIRGPDVARNELETRLEDAMNNYRPRSSRLND